MALALTVVLLRSCDAAVTGDTRQPARSAGLYDVDASFMSSAA
jgi:hypothetical protein